MCVSSCSALQEQPQHHGICNVKVVLQATCAGHSTLHESPCVWWVVNDLLQRIVIMLCIFAQQMTCRIAYIGNIAVLSCDSAFLCLKYSGQWCCRAISLLSVPVAQCSSVCEIG